MSHIVAQLEELKAQCLALSLPVSGSKAALAARLKDHQQQGATHFILSIHSLTPYMTSSSTNSKHSRRTQ